MSAKKCTVTIVDKSNGKERHVRQLTLNCTGEHALAKIVGFFGVVLQPRKNEPRERPEHGPEEQTPVPATMPPDAEELQEARFEEGFPRALTHEE